MYPVCMYYRKVHFLRFYLTRKSRIIKMMMLILKDLYSTTKFWHHSGQAGLANLSVKRLYRLLGLLMLLFFYYRYYFYYCYYYYWMGGFNTSLLSKILTGNLLTVVNKSALTKLSLWHIKSCYNLSVSFYCQIKMSNKRYNIITWY